MTEDSVDSLEQLDGLFEAVRRSFKFCAQPLARLLHSRCIQRCAGEAYGVAWESSASLASESKRGLACLREIPGARATLFALSGGEIALPTAYVKLPPTRSLPPSLRKKAGERASERERERETRESLPCTIPHSAPLYILH